MFLLQQNYLKRLPEGVEKSRQLLIYQLSYLLLKSIYTLIINCPNRNLDQGQLIAVSITYNSRIALCVAHEVVILIALAADIISFPQMPKYICFHFVATTRTQNNEFPFDKAKLNLKMMMWLQ